jgi:hypothetical protein
MAGEKSGAFLVSKTGSPQGMLHCAFKHFFQI